MPGTVVRPHPPCGHLPPQAGEGRLAHSARSCGINRTTNVGKPFLPPSHGGTRGGARDGASFEERGRCPKGGWGPSMAAARLAAGTGKCFPPPSHEGRNPGHSEGIDFDDAFRCRIGGRKHMKKPPFGGF